MLHHTGSGPVQVSEAVPPVQLWQPEPHSAGCGTPGNALKFAESSSGTSAGMTRSSWTETMSWYNGQLIKT